MYPYQGMVYQAAMWGGGEEDAAGVGGVSVASVVVVADGVASSFRPLQYSRPATSPTTQSRPSSRPVPVIAEHGTIRHLCDAISCSPRAWSVSVSMSRSEHHVGDTTDAVTHIPDLLVWHRAREVLLVRENKERRASQTLKSATCTPLQQNAAPIHSRPQQAGHAAPPRHH
jgi:hypothetical protein